MGALAMLDRILLVALTPLALAGGTTTSWLKEQWASHLAPGRVDPPSIRPIGPGPARGLSITRGRDGLLYTQVRINGVPVDMVVDTGASRTILSNEDARRVLSAQAFAPAGDAVPQGRRTGTIMTLGGERDLAIQSLGSVELAGRRYKQLEAGLVDGSPVSVIGLDWLALTGPITISLGA